MATKEQRQQVLGDILKRDGGIKASAVLRAAKPKKSPIHDEFEWDDAIAGREYRLTQARRIIQITPIRDATGRESRLVNIPVEKIDGPTAVVQEKEGVYRPIEDVAREPSDYEKCLKQLMQQRNAMDVTIEQLQRSVPKKKEKKDLMQQLHEAMDVVKATLRLMLKEA